MDLLACRNTSLSDASSFFKPFSRYFVLLPGQRYSIENYIYDPIYIAILLMDIEGAHNIFQELNIDETINHFSLGEKTDAFLQNIVDWVLAKYYSVFTVSNRDVKTKVHYTNGKIISLPTWYLNFNGHDLEIRLKKVFPALEKFKSEGDLQEKMITIIGKCYPLVPIETKKSLEEIINQA